jgi:hypothetical protein
MQIMKQIGSIEKIIKCKAKFDSSFAWQVAEMLAVMPHFHGHFATCGDWQHGCHAGYRESHITQNPPTNTW